MFGIENKQKKCTRGSDFHHIKYKNLLNEFRKTNKFPETKLKAKRALNLIFNCLNFMPTSPLKLLTDVVFPFS